MARIVFLTNNITVEIGSSPACNPFFLQAPPTFSFERTIFPLKTVSTSVFLKKYQLQRKLRHIVSLAKLDGSEPFVREARSENPKSLNNDGTSTEKNATPSISSLSSPTDFVEWGGQIPSRRRLFLGAALASSVSLGSNFLGCTSFILGKFPQTSRDWKLDQVYPVDGFLRCVENTAGFGENIFPIRIPTHSA